MTLTETTAHLDTLPGVLALFWFMENVGDEHPHRNELFFYCRERVRRYDAAGWVGQHRSDTVKFLHHFEES